MLRMGITGGVGMGKSTCASLLRDQGVPVIDTDDLARELVQPGQLALVEIQDEFGHGMLNESGELDRTALASVVFADPAARRRLEAILHPRIQRAWLERLAIFEAQAHQLAAVVIPLLYETAVEPEFDAVVCVACSEVEQAARLVTRGWSEAESGRRQAAQFPVTEKIRRAHFVIWTEGELEAHRQQLRLVLARLKNSA